MTNKPSFPLEYLEERRRYCLHNWGCALWQVYISKPGTHQREVGVQWLGQCERALLEIEFLIEEERKKPA